MKLSRFRLCLLPVVLSATAALFAQQSSAPAAQQPVMAMANTDGGHAVPLINGYEPKWWKEAVVYQIYPRSFQDSNGDGIGDLKGITQHLDYLKSLGVNVIWLSPHYDSPNADNGYDIRDYRKVMKEFGTMADFDTMLAGIKSHGMRLIIDLVVNHTSDEHYWFQQSRKSKDNPYRDYYIWRPGKIGPDGKMGPPNNYPSFFSGSAWQLDPLTNEYYLHLFAVKQPDLNWENPKVRQEVYSLMRYWLDKGVDGFRMDVIPLISKQPGLPDLTADQLQSYGFVTLWANGPRRDEFLREMNREVLSKYNDMSVGEAIGIPLEREADLVDSRRHELNEIFNFDVIRLGRGVGYTGAPFSLPALKAIYDAHARVLGKTDWDTVFLSNHDNSRMVSRFGDTSTEANRAASAKLLETMILSLRGTPYMYEGDELGMTNFPFTRLDQFNDIEVKNMYKADVLTGKMTEQQLITGAATYGRDNSRTPMQWDASTNGGFSAHAPWLAENPNYKTINAAAEEKNANSVLNYVKQMIALRARTPAFVYGDYRDLDPQNTHVYAYTRSLGPQQYLIVLNFSAQPVDYTLPDAMKSGTPLLTNGARGSADAEGGNGTLHLAPWEARVYQQTPQQAAR